MDAKGCIVLGKNESDDEEEVYSKEESESEPESECDKWDNDCRIVISQPKNSHTGYHLMPTCSKDPAAIPSKKIKLSLELRADIVSESFKTNFKSNWTQNHKFTGCDVELITCPFKVCLINNFLENGGFLNEIRQEFNEIDWNVRTMDLYEFAQSQDLKHLTKFTAISSLYKFLQTEVMKYVAEIAGLALTHVSATCSYYANTDYLLVHDDQRDDRLVAFILYLSPDWGEHLGGSLQLLDKDAIGHPQNVVRSIAPQNNQFVFFPVTNDSYHQVAEVTSLTQCRFSINGWFHTTTPPIFTSPLFTFTESGLYGTIKHPPGTFDGDLETWINNNYLENEICDEIQEYFEKHSEVSLKEFLRVEPFAELAQILACGGLTWVKIGPPNRFNYETLQNDNLPIVLDRLLQLFRSKQFFGLLRRYTSLDLVKRCAKMRFELQRWIPGSYSLLGDYDWYEKKELDVIINFGSNCNSDVVGARTMYVTTDEEVQNALITLDPVENNLNLVYRDTARFTNYYSKLSRCQCFYTLICTYSE